MPLNSVAINILTGGSAFLPEGTAFLATTIEVGDFLAETGAFLAAIVMECFLATRAEDRDFLTGTTLFTTTRAEEES
jgi:hypothetical protein